MRSNWYEPVKRDRSKRLRHSLIASALLSKDWIRTTIVRANREIIAWYCIIDKDRRALTKDTHVKWSYILKWLNVPKFFQNIWQLHSNQTNIVVHTFQLEMPKPLEKPSYSNDLPINVERGYNLPLDPLYNAEKKNADKNGSRPGQDQREMVRDQIAN